MSNYKSKLFKMFVFNPSKTVSFVWTALKLFLDDVTKDKIKFVKSQSEYDEIYTHIDRSQMEIKYHGT